MKILLAFAAVIVFAQASSTPAGVPCLRDEDCRASECCYKKHDNLVVSKRQGTFEGYPYPHQQDLTHVRGVCRSYKMEGDFCSMFDKVNGYCSCNEKMGMKCKFVSDPVSPIVKRKRKVYVPGPGSFKCTQDLLLS